MNIYMDKDNEAVLLVLKDADPFKAFFKKVDGLKVMKPLSLTEKLDYVKQELLDLKTFLESLGLFYYSIKIDDENNPPDVLFGFYLSIKKYAISNEAILVFDIIKTKEG